MDRKLDEGYPLKSTLLYIAVPLVVTTIALARAAALSMSRVVVLSVGGVLICIPWGIPGVIICAAIGAGVGLAVGMAVKYYLRQHQPAALRLLLSSHADFELSLLLIWGAAAALAFYFIEWLMFPGVSGAIAAACVMLGRALILPELNDLYWLANRKLEEGELVEEKALSEVGA